MAARQLTAGSFQPILSSFLECFLDKEDIVYLKISKTIADIMIKLYPHLIEYVDTKGNLFFELKKALYGLKKSPRLWYNDLTNKVKELGYAINADDPCVFSKLGNGTTLDLDLFT